MANIHQRLKALETDTEIKSSIQRIDNGDHVLVGGKQGYLKVPRQLTITEWESAIQRPCIEHQI